MLRPTWPLIAAFVVTRAVLIALTGATINVAASSPDIALYSGWAEAIKDGFVPYLDVPIEYPPGVLPFVVVSDYIAVGIPYRTAFALLMLAVDLVGFVGLLRAGRKGRSVTGAWVWVMAVFLLGPIVYLRLDLIPAVATIWALERAAASAVTTSGALFSFGVMAKLYPVLLMPGAWWHSARRQRFLAGAGGVIAMALLPFVTTLPRLWDQVLGYHSDRGIQIESTWGAALMVALRRGYNVTVEQAFGASHIRSPVSSTLETIAALLSIGVVLLSTWFMISKIARGDWRRVTVALYGSLAVVMFTGTVLSPQFIVWLIALAAIALSFDESPARSSLLLVVPVAALTQFVFPFNYEDLKAGELEPLLLLIARNLLILGAGLTAFLGLRKAAPASD